MGKPNNVMSFNKRNLKKNRKKLLKKNFQIKVECMRIEDLIKLKLKPTNDYQKNYSNEQIMKQSRCLSPVQSLDEKGYEFSIIDGKLKVFVKERISIMDGFSNDWYEEDELNPQSMRFVSIEEITDYNSLWFTTQTGWYSKNDLIPYVGIRKKNSNDDYMWYSWDNSSVLRPLCETLCWDENNFTLFSKYMFKQTG
jgi:hypothetical protein